MDDLLKWADGLNPDDYAEKPKKQKIDKGDSSVASVLDDEFAKLGYSGTARLSLLGDIGRENAWNRNTIFRGHLDPKNKAFNRGIISWQGNRRTALDNYLKQQGVLGRGDDEELRAMARFMDTELKTQFTNSYNKLQNAKNTAEASEALRQYIKYVPTSPYNTPDKDFVTRNNRDWAERAKKLGLAQDIDIDGILAEVDSVLGTPKSNKEKEVDVDAVIREVDELLGQTSDKSPVKVAPSPTVPGNVYLDNPPLAKDVLPPYQPNGQQTQTVAQPQNDPLAPLQIETLGGVAGGVPMPVERPQQPLTISDLQGEAQQPLATDDDYQAYAEYVTSQGQTPMSRQDFDVAAQAQGRVGDVTAEIQSEPQIPQGRPQSAQSPVIRENRITERSQQQSPPQEHQPQGQPAQEEARAYVKWSGGSGSARKEALDDAASTLSSQIGVDFDLVSKRLESANFAEGELSEEVAKRKKEQRRQISIGLDANAVAELKEKQHQRQQMKAALEARTKVYEQYGDLPSVAQLKALKDEGIKDFQGKPIDEAIATEQAAFKTAEEGLGSTSQVTAGRPFEDGMSFVVHNSQKRRFSQEEINEVIAKHGSFSEREKYQKEIEEKYRFRPMAFPVEAAKNFGSFIAKLPAKAVQSALAATDATGHTALIEAVTGKDMKPSENPVWKWAEDFQNSIDDLKNKELQDHPDAYIQKFLANEGAEAFAQLATQIVLAPVSGGLSLGIPIMEAGLAQYKEADKAGAGRLLRLGAATIGAGAGVPDALIKARWLRNLSPKMRDNFFGKMADSLVNRYSRYVGREEGEQLARLTIGGMVKKAGVGGGAEYGQEGLEDVVNKAFAKVTYKPEMTWKDVITPEKGATRGYMAAGLVGIFGGGLGAVTQNMAYDQLVNAESILNQAVRSGQITPEQFQEAVAAAKAELETRQKEITQPTAQPNAELSPDTITTPAEAVNVPESKESPITEVQAEARPVAKDETLEVGQAVTLKNGKDAVVVEDTGAMVSVKDGDKTKWVNKTDLSLTRDRDVLKETENPNTLERPTLEEENETNIPAQSSSMDSEALAEDTDAKGEIPVAGTKPADTVTLGDTSVTVNRLPLKAQKASAIQDATIKRVQDDAQGHYDRYVEKHGDKVWDADKARELFDEFNENSMENTQAVHAAASALIRLGFNKRLKELPEGSDVLLTAGGAGSGKSTALASIDAPLTYDSLMSKPEAAIRDIKNILAQGKMPIIGYVHRPIKNAVRGMMRRMDDATRPEDRRPVEIETMAFGHFNAQKGFLDVVAPYAEENGIAARAFETVENESPREISYDDLAKVRYNSLEDVKDEVIRTIESELATGSYSAETESYFRQQLQSVRGEGKEGSSSESNKRGSKSSGVQSEATQESGRQSQQGPDPQTAEKGRQGVERGLSPEGGKDIRSDEGQSDESGRGTQDAGATPSSETGAERPGSERSDSGDGKGEGVSSDAIGQAIDKAIFESDKEIEDALNKSLPNRFQETLKKTDRGEFKPSVHFQDSMQGWKEGAETIVSEKGLEGAHAEYFSNNELKPAVKNALGLALIDAYGQLNELDKVNTLASDMIEESVELGRAIKALDLANRYDPKSWSFIAEKLKSRTKQPLTQEEYSKGKQAVEAYADAADDIALSEAFESENRGKAKAAEKLGKGLEKAISFGEQLGTEQAGELEALKKEVARLQKELDSIRRPKPKVTKRARQLLKEIVEHKEADRKIIQQFIRESERGSLPIRPKPKFKLNNEDVGLTEEQFDALKRLAAEKLMPALNSGEMGVSEFSVWLNNEVKGRLSPRQIEQITAAAYMETRQVREFNYNAEQMAKRQNRREFHQLHYRVLGEQSKRYREQVRQAIENAEASPRDAFSRQLVQTAANMDVSNHVLTGADFLRLTNNLTKWKSLMRSLLPGISNKELSDIYKQSFELRKAAIEDLKRVRAEIRENKELTDKEYADLQREKRKKISKMMRARANLQAYYASLSRTKAQKVARGVSQTTNIFRSVQASYDVSFAGRQGAALNAMETRASIAGLWLGGQESITQEAFDNFVYEMESDPLVDEMKQYGWSSRAILRDARDFEEFYLSQLPMKLGDIEAETSAGKAAALVPRAIGQGFQISERLFELQGDMQGYKVYEKWKSEIDALADANPNFDVDKAKRHLIRVINAGVGRGNFLREFRQGSETAKVLSELFYSPRFMLSRPEFAWYMSPPGLLLSAPKGTKKIMLKKALNLYSKASLLLLPLAMLGLTSLDPEDEEFLQIRVGDTKFDITGKLAEAIRPVFMTFKGGGYYFMSLSDDPATAETGRAGMKRLVSYYSDANDWMRTFRGKMSPQASLVYDWAKGEDFLGRPFTWENAIASRMIPLTFQSAWNALTYDAKESAMRRPANLSTFGENVGKVVSGEFNHNLGRVGTALLLDTVGIGTGIYEKDARTVAAKEAERLTSADFGPKTERQEMAEIDHEGTPKWRIAGSLIRLMRFGHDITPELEKYKKEGILTAEDTQNIVTRGDRLYIEDRLQKASIGEIAQVLRFTTPYNDLIRPLMGKVDKAREIERERLLQLLKSKADAKGKQGKLTAEDEQILAEFLPDFKPETTQKSKVLEAARSLLERKKNGENIEAELNRLQRQKLLSEKTAAAIRRGNSDSMLYMTIEKDPQKLLEAFQQTQAGDEKEKRQARQFMIDKFNASKSAENRAIYLKALKEVLEPAAYERFARIHERKSRTEQSEP